MTPTTETVRSMTRPLYAIASKVVRSTRRSVDPVRFGLLELALRSHQVRPSQVSRELAVSASSVTRQLQVLQAEGKIGLVADASDRRATLLSITEAGVEELRGVEDQGVEFFRALVADWPAEDVETLATLLGRLLERLEASSSARPRGDIRAG